jgi:hypothetical protein
MDKLQEKRLKSENNTKTKKKQQRRYRIKPCASLFFAVHSSR